MSWLEKLRVSDVSALRTLKARGSVRWVRAYEPVSMSAFETLSATAKYQSG